MRTRLLIAAIIGVVFSFADVRALGRTADHCASDLCCNPNNICMDDFSQCCPPSTGEAPCAPSPCSGYCNAGGCPPLT